MPIFEYECSNCHLRLERIEPRYTEATPECKRCGERTEHVYSVPQFHDWNRIMGTTDAQPYVTRNIARDGSPIEIRSHQQLAEECKKAGVVPAFEKQSRIG